MQKTSIYWGFSRAVVVSRDRAYLLAHLPELEAQRIFLTQVFRWTGSWASYRVDGPCVGICASHDPELAVLCLQPYGEVHVAKAGGFSLEHIDPTENGPRSIGMLRDLKEIEGSVFAVGMRRQVYRRNTDGEWYKFDYGLRAPHDEKLVSGLNSIDGFSKDNLYAVGWNGEIWIYSDDKWTCVPPITNLKLERVVCVPSEDIVYACGQKGILLKGFSDKWEVLEHDIVVDQFWGMEWFAGFLWLATDNAVYRLTGAGNLEKIDFNIGDDGLTCGYLSSRDGLLWSVGANHILSTNDGNIWRLEVIP